MANQAENSHSARRVALVTGGSRGIGFAVAAALLQEGIDVIVSARGQADLDDAVARLGAADASAGGRVFGHACDVRDHDSVARLFNFADERAGGLDILINNAGIGIFKPVAEMSVEEWRAVIETNLNSLFYCSHAALPRMRARGGGYIINIGSLAGKNAFPGGAAYNASKFGLIGFSEALMQEVRYDNIRVSYVMPGSVNTVFGGGNVIEEENWKLAPEDIAQVVVDLLHHPARSLPSRVEIRPARPPRK